MNEWRSVKILYTCIIFMTSKAFLLKFGDWKCWMPKSLVASATKDNTVLKVSLNTDMRISLFKDGTDASDPRSKGEIRDMTCEQMIEMLDSLYGARTNRATEDQPIF